MCEKVCTAKTKSTNISMNFLMKIQKIFNVIINNIIFCGAIMFYHTINQHKKQLLNKKLMIINHNHLVTICMVI